jgi:hypothetical protein
LGSKTYLVLMSVAITPDGGCAFTPPPFDKVLTTLACPAAHR